MQILHEFNTHFCKEWFAYLKYFDNVIFSPVYYWLYHSRPWHGITSPSFFNFLFTYLFLIKISSWFHLFFLYLSYSCPYTMYIQSYCNNNMQEGSHVLTSPNVWPLHQVNQVYTDPITEGRNSVQRELVTGIYKTCIVVYVLIF